MGLGSIGISELVVIFTIVLVFFGPKRFPEIARPMGSLQFGPGAFQLFLDMGCALHCSFFRLPYFFQVRKLPFQLVDLLLQYIQALDRCLV